MIRELWQRLWKRRQLAKPSPYAHLDLPTLQAKLSEEFAKSKEDNPETLRLLADEVIRRFGRYGHSSLIGILWFELLKEEYDKFVQETLSIEEIKTIERQAEHPLSTMALNQLGDALSNANMAYLVYSNERAQAQVAVEKRCIAREIFKRLNNDIKFLKNLIIIIDPTLLQV